MKFKEFKEEVKKAYAKRFPNSLCEVYIFKCLGRSLCITCRFVENEKEVPFGIMGNDMFYASMSINLPDNFGDDDDLPENMVLEWQSSCIKAKPENKYLAYDAVNVSHRKTTGDAKKIIKALDKYFQRLYEATVKLFEEGKIHDNFADLAAQKIVR
jgi:hypothetical protein